MLLQFSSDTLLEEWQTHLASTCGKLRDAQGRNISNKQLHELYDNIYCETYISSVVVFASDILGLPLNFSTIRIYV